MKCIGTSFTREQALFAKREFKREWHLTINAYHCENCDGYHIRGNARGLKLPPKAIQIANFVARGFTTAEIGPMMDPPLKKKSVDWYTEELRRQFAAMNSTHLIMILTALGVIDPADFIPQIKEAMNGDDSRNRPQELHGQTV